MSFRVSRKKALEVETERIAAIIMMPKYWRREWTDTSLLAEMKELGLEYTLAEIRAINDELHRQGVVEDVGEAEAPPE